MAISAGDIQRTSAYFFCRKLTGPNFDIPSIPESFPVSSAGVLIFAVSIGLGRVSRSQVEHWCALARAAPNSLVDCFYWTGPKGERIPRAAFRLTYVADGEELAKVRAMEKTL